jgi:hypothetical protein
VLLALLDVVGFDAIDGVEESGIAMAAHAGRLRDARGTSWVCLMSDRGGRKRRMRGFVGNEGYGSLFWCVGYSSSVLLMARDCWAAKLSILRQPDVERLTLRQTTMLIPDGSND